MVIKWRHQLIAFSFISLFSLINGISLAPLQRVECTKGVVCALNKDHLDFFVVGDTGGISFDVGAKFLNFIHATEAQHRTADSMAEVAEKNGLDFIINVGDNVYWNGVDNELDTRFNTVFEHVYDDNRLLVPWYMIAGNHDHLGNITGQTAYTNYSNKWTFPKLYYTAQYAFDGYSRTVDFIFIDTIVLCGNSIDVDSRSILSWLRAHKHVPDKPAPGYTKMAEEQWIWIEEQLKNSRADYLFVVGHYPIHSISAHGPVKCLADKLDPLLRKYQVSAYFSGHDHALQFFKSDNPINDSSQRLLVNPSYYFVSGTGSRTDSSETHMATDGKHLFYHWPRKEDIPFWRRWTKHGQMGLGWGGFMRFRLDPDQATFYFYIRSADLEYQETLQPRKQKVFV